MSQVNITLNTNTVDINTTNNQIVVTDPTNPNVVNITQPVTSVVEVITAGPQGTPGPAGIIPNTGSFATTGSNSFNGNQIITGSLSQGIRNSAIGSSSHAEGSGSIARGIGSHAEGSFTNASGSYSHTEGGTTFALGSYSHAEGASTRAIGLYSHAEGEIAYALGIGSHAEGGYTIASGSYSHAEGYYTSASGNYSHAEGSGSIASGIGSHAEGRLTIASGNYSHAEAWLTKAIGNYSHAEGVDTSGSGEGSHAEGASTLAFGTYSHAEGSNTQAVSLASHAEGYYTTASGDYSHVEGSSTQTIGNYSHAEGTATLTGITSAFATEKTDGILNGLVTLDSEYGDISSYFTQNGYLYIHYSDESTEISEWASYLITSINWDGTNTTIQLIDGSIDANQAFVGDITYLTNNGVFGGDSTIPGPSAHAEGDTTRAVGPYSHAEGQTTYALGLGSHAEGKSTYAVGNWSHAEGVGTRAIGNNSHAEGEYTQAIANSSHAEGFYTIASARRQHVQGMYNITSSVEGAFILGNGSAENDRSNLIFAAGNSVQITGSLIVSGSNTFTNIGPAVFSGSINVTQGISGSFSGSGANLNSIPASAITGLSSTQIATGSVTASVSTGTGSFQITSGSTSFLFISSSGNVGIGTNAPTSPLTVVGAVNATTFNANFAVLSTRASKADLYGFTGPTLSYYNGVSIVPALTVLPTGNIAINTTTDAGHKLYVSGSGVSGSLNVDGTLYVSGSRVGIGTSTPTASLHIASPGAIATDIAFKVRNSANTRDFLVVNGAGDVFNNGAGGVTSNTFFGENSGRLTIGANNSFFGRSAGQSNTTGSSNSFFGVNAGFSNTTGNSNSFFGLNAGFNNTTGGNSNSFFGVNAGLSNTTGSNNSFFGQSAGLNTTTGSNNSFVGTSAGRYIADGITNLTAVDNSVFLGFDTRANGNSQTNQIVIGHNAIGIGSNSVVLGNDSITTTALKGNVGIGVTTLTAKLQVKGTGATTSTTALRVENSNASASLLVNDAGNVGIGTPSPSASLDIVGNVRIVTTPSAGNIVRPDNVGAAFQFGNGTNTAYGEFRFKNTGGTDIGRLLENGNFGIGLITPSASLHISGASSANLLRIDSPASSSILFVTGSGNVGIGTSTPAYTLDVSGSARVSDISYLTLGARIGTTTTTAGIFPSGTSGRESLNLRSSLLPTDTGNDVVITNGQGDVGNTSSIRSLLTVARSFAPTSGTGIYNLIQVNPTINQTGGANGITRGLYINPTITSASDFRAIETTQGRNIFTDTYVASGSANSGSLLDLSQTWNTTGTPIAIKLNVTDTASNSLSDLMSLQVGGSARFRILKSGYFAHNTGGEIAGSVIIGSNVVTPSARLHVRGSGATSATTTFLLQNSTPTNLLSINDIGQVAFTSPTMSLAASQSAFSISPIISASAVVGGQYYGVNITPTFFQTTGSQTKTAFRVAATYTGSSAAATGGTNIIADFGSTSAGSQLTVTDVTSGSIYMVNDVSGLPIIEATSDWGVKIYDFPRVVLEKTGSQVNINGTLQVSGSFILPLSQSATPQTGSAYWSGSLLFIYNGTRYMSASFF